MLVYHQLFTLPVEISTLFLWAFKLTHCTLYVQLWQPQAWKNQLLHTPPFFVELFHPKKITGFGGPSFSASWVGGRSKANIRPDCCWLFANPFWFKKNHEERMTPQNCSILFNLSFGLPRFGFNRQKHHFFLFNWRHLYFDLLQMVGKSSKMFQTPSSKWCM